MIRSLLIANRGEIAVRIIRTARALGVRSVAVYSDADVDGWHVAAADAAVRLGPAPARDSYLRGDLVIEAALASGCDAIHPGFGFLAENAAFAAACVEAGLIFVGPPAEAIRLMGSKDAARDRMIEADVPVVPGAGADAVAADAHAAAEQVGFPLLVKAAAGGGGKGMRVVREADALTDTLAAVRREAKAAFGDDTVLMERWVERARHVEVQVFADDHGRCIALFDRDCSTQRRHQKVIEEAPAPDIPDALRAAMAEAAVAAARAVDYRGAGTVEFLLANDAFFFLEMNTRLQVEHPVTELVSGQDLVAWQLRVASGEPLPVTADALVCTGHAVEARLYAEDPAGGFLPAVGSLDLLLLPKHLPGIRVDAGVRQGDVVSPHYDPMIAKIIAHGRDRCEAMARLGAALAATRIHGVKTNLDLLRALIADPALRAGPVHTTWLEGEVERLLPVTPATRETLAVAALGVALARADAVTRPGSDPFATLRGFRLNGAPRERVTLGISGTGSDPGADAKAVLIVERTQDGFVVELEGDRMAATARLDADVLRASVGGTAGTWHLVHAPAAMPPRVTLLGPAGEHAFLLHDELAAALDRDEAVPGSLLAPMPGQVLAVHVAAGDRVEAGTVLLVLEAMKMEHGIRAPHAGTVRAVHFAVGARVDDGAVLVELEEG